VAHLTGSLDTGFLPRRNLQPTSAAPCLARWATARPVERYTGFVRVYLAASMTTPAAEMATVQALLAALENAGHCVPSRHVADPAAVSRDAELSDAQLAGRDLSWLAGCNAVIAEVSTPSHGVGVEVMAASAAGIPILALARRGARVSRLLAGLPGVRLAPYDSVEQAAAQAIQFLASMSSAIGPEGTDVH